MVDPRNVLISGRDSSRNSVRMPLRGHEINGAVLVTLIGIRPGSQITRLASLAVRVSIADICYEKALLG